MKKQLIGCLTLLLLACLIPAGLQAQAEVTPPEGLSRSAWKRAHKRWQLIRFPAHITGVDSAVFTGQIYAIDGDTLLLWPSPEHFVPGPEAQLLRLAVADIEGIHILRERSFWRGAGKAALIVGGPALLLDVENADGDFLPPVVHLLVTGALITTPVALIAGAVHKAGQVDKDFRISGDLESDVATLERVATYSLYPAGIPPQAPRDDVPTSSLAPDLQELEHARAYSPLLKKLFPSRRVFLEFYPGVGYSTASTQMAEAMGEASSSTNHTSPLILGGEAMFKVKNHWRAGAAFQYARRISMIQETDIIGSGGFKSYTYYSFNDPAFLAGLVEYVHQPMHGLTSHRIEWSAAAGLSLLFTRMSQSAGFMRENTTWGFAEGEVYKKAQLPGLLLPSRLRFYPQKTSPLASKAKCTGYFHMLSRRYPLIRPNTVPPLMRCYSKGPAPHRQW
ncbi:MAG: hypothetical protein D6722_25580 [Bacteroidetes bacterium]|nr:MAG: hypothetical protein D6722_25580 [Bacteroidota bacterium]